MLYGKRSHNKSLPYKNLGQAPTIGNLINCPYPIPFFAKSEVSTEMCFSDDYVYPTRDNRIPASAENFAIQKNFVDTPCHLRDPDMAIVDAAPSSSAPRNGFSAPCASEPKHVGCNVGVHLSTPRKRCKLLFRLGALHLSHLGQKVQILLLRNLGNVAFFSF